jgi:uncharacterized phage-associated protein
MSENDLTNLKLQKILFYAQAESLRETGNALFSDTIEAWKYGPVVPAVYEWLKGCGAYPITAFDIETDTSKIDNKSSDLLDRIWSAYSKYSAGYLVDRTHEKGSPWQLNFAEGKSNQIPNDQIKNAKLQAEW